MFVDRDWPRLNASSLLSASAELLVKSWSLDVSGLDFSVLVSVLVLHPSSLGLGRKSWFKRTRWSRWWKHHQQREQQQSKRKTWNNLLRRWPERRCSNLMIDVANIRPRVCCTSQSNDGGHYVYGQHDIHCQHDIADLYRGRGMGFGAACVTLRKSSSTVE